MNSASSIRPLLSGRPSSSTAAGTPRSTAVVTVLPVATLVRNCYSLRTPSIGEDDEGARHWWNDDQSQLNRRTCDRVVPSGLQLPPIHPMRRTMHVSNMRRAKRLVALAAGLSLVAMACGGDDDDDGTTATTAGEEEHRDDHGTETDRRRQTTAQRRTRPPQPGATAPATRRRAGRRDGDDDHHRPQPRRRVGGRHADHVGRLRVHVAGEPQHAWLDRHHRMGQDHLGRGR